MSVLECHQLKHYVFFEEGLYISYCYVVGLICLLSPIRAIQFLPYKHVKAD